MNLRKTTNSTAVMVVVVLIATIVAWSTMTSLSPKLIFAQTNEKFSAKLSGSNEVPQLWHISIRASKERTVQS